MTHVTYSPWRIRGDGTRERDRIREMRGGVRLVETEVEFRHTIRVYYTDHEGVRRVVEPSLPPREALRLKGAGV